MKIGLDARFLSRVGASAFFALAMLLSTGAQANSITPDSINPWFHILDCWDAMLHDPGAHQASCSPGQPGSNSSLVTPVHGGGTSTPQQTCPSVGNLSHPVTSTYQVASLDDSIAAPSSGRKAQNLFADCGPSCFPCANAQRDALPFDVLRVASLDEQLRSPALKAVVHNMIVACCPGGDR